MRSRTKAVDLDISIIWQGLFFTLMALFGSILTLAYSTISLMENVLSFVRLFIYLIFSLALRNFAFFRVFRASVASFEMHSKYSLTPFVWRFRFKGEKSDVFSIPNIAFSADVPYDWIV